MNSPGNPWNSLIAAVERNDDWRGIVSGVWIPNGLAGDTDNRVLCTDVLESRPERCGQGGNHMG